MHKLSSEDIVQGAQAITRLYKFVCIKYRANSEEIIVPGSFKWCRKRVQGKQIVWPVKLCCPTFK